jgi:hypothetical protein
VTFGKEKETRVGRHVERKLTELEKVEVHCLLIRRSAVLGKEVM